MPPGPLLDAVEARVTLLLSDRDVRAVCDIGVMVGAIEDGLRKEAKGVGSQLPERVNLGHGEKFLRVMPAMLPEAGLLGLKFFHGSMKDGIRYVVAVCAMDSGKVLALVDASYLTAARTGATSGVATRLLAAEDAGTVGVIGSGLEAETNLFAVAAVRKIRSVRVFSRNPERRRGFAERMSGMLGVPVTDTPTPQEAVTGTDIVVVATNTGVGGEPAFRGAWLEPGQHVVSIGSTTAALREIDEDTFLGAGTVVLDAHLEQMGHESGDIAALLRRRPNWSAAVSLDDLITGEALGRRQAEDVTLFKSVGTAAQDLIGAMCIVREARAIGIGTEVDEVAAPKFM